MCSTASRRSTNESEADRFHAIASTNDCPGAGACAVAVGPPARRVARRRVGRYAGPHSLVDAVATLPFLVEMWGPPEAPRYVVSKVSDKRLVTDPKFVEGVTLTWWNAVPFDREIDVQSDRETGGRPDSRRARVLDSLTFRALGYGPPPDEHWVVIGYRDLADDVVRQRRRVPVASRRR